MIRQFLCIIFTIGRIWIKSSKRHTQNLGSCCGRNKGFFELPTWQISYFATSIEVINYMQMVVLHCRQPVKEWVMKKFCIFHWQWKVLRNSKADHTSSRVDKKNPIIYAKKSCWWFPNLFFFFEWCTFFVFRVNCCLLKLRQLR